MMTMTQVTQVTVYYDKYVEEGEHLPIAGGSVNFPDTT